ncbi:PREDICTED: uncharacterized protein LOC107167182 [Diuraphis noxia]|uniref:uncharacterized protein LOC107167182 n=1 Tax=Diuraphis noxia TaxID=143948 RepID=UPI0007639F27|nr:PREDICTED: uncharacterized protein LOC107167182 [Diuraphis noxia]
MLESDVDRYVCCGHSFYQDHTIDDNGKTSIIFGCLELIQEVVGQGGSELHADATFKIVPVAPKCRQLLVMHLIIQNHSIPVIYVLMESKTELAYTLVLRKCKAMFPAIQPECIMTDYEIALKNAFNIIYPESVQHACWFHHYVQCLVKNLKSNGFSNYVKNNQEAQICIKMTSKSRVLFYIFFQLLVTYKNTRRFSVYGVPRRINNNVESFHSGLKEKFQSLHPNLWTFLDHLKRLSLKNHVTIKQLRRGQRVSRPVKMKYLLNSVRIQTATTQLELGVINVKEFLLQCSHCAERYLREEINWDI